LTPDDAIRPLPLHTVIPGHRDSGEPGIFFSSARFRINAQSAPSGMTDEVHAPRMLRSAQAMRC